MKIFSFAFLNRLSTRKGMCQSEKTSIFFCLVHIPLTSSITRMMAYSCYKVLTWLAIFLDWWEFVETNWSLWLRILQTRNERLHYNFVYNNKGILIDLFSLAFVLNGNWQLHRIRKIQWTRGTDELRRKKGSQGYMKMVITKLQMVQKRR